MTDNQTQSESTQSPPPPESPELWVDLCALDDVPDPDSGGKYVTYGNRSLAVVRNRHGGAYVMNDTCPHAGASLSAGTIRDGCITCPWHGWTFDIQTGVCPDNDALRVRGYPTRVVSERVQARIE